VYAAMKVRTRSLELHLGQDLGLPRCRLNAATGVPHRLHWVRCRGQWLGISLGISRLPARGLGFDMRRRPAMAFGILGRARRKSSRIFFWSGVGVVALQP
jgi:hypothetical protein